jgi:hypothetical protein
MKHDFKIAELAQRCGGVAGHESPRQDVIPVETVGAKVQKQNGFERPNGGAGPIIL